MSVLDTTIKKVTDKLQHLLKQHQLLQKENERLASQVQLLQEKNKELSENIEQYQQKVAILKAAAGQMNETDKKAFEKKINQYLKEVDKCITLLSE